MKRQIALLVLGALFGACVMFLIQARDLERLYVERSMLTMQYDELWKENLQLTAQQHEPKKPITIQSIRVMVDTNDSHIDIKITQFVKQRLDYLIGKPVNIVLEDPEIPYQVLDGRTLAIEGSQYQLRVRTIAVGQSIYVRVSTKRIAVQSG